MNRNVFIAGIVAVTLAGAGIIAYRHSRGAHGAQVRAEIYYCPMHPDYTSDKPGDCPICGMHLVKRQTAQAPAARRIMFYRSPMDPAVTSKVPMKDGMGMDYVPVYESSAPQVAGRGAVEIPPEKQQLIGLRTGEAAYRDLTTVVRASGKVAYDPDLYRALNEYKEALAAYGKMKDSSWPQAREGAKAVLDSAELKLRQSGFGEEQLAGVQRDPARYENLLLPGTRVWVYAQIYEYESAAVKPGQKVRVTSSAYPGKEFRGTVRSVDPIFSEETRTLRARIETEDPQKELRPEMYVETEIKADPGRVLTVPVSAVLDTGERQLAFVLTGKDSFEPREVKTGRRNETYAEVLSGLRNGEKVVTSANFLVDSESRMKAALGN